MKHDEAVQTATYSDQRAGDTELGSSVHTLVHQTDPAPDSIALSPARRVLQTLKNPLVLSLIIWLGLLFMVIKSILFD